MSIKQSIQQSFQNLRQRAESVQSVAEWLVDNPSLLVRNAIYQRMKHGDSLDGNSYIASYFEILSLKIKLAYTSEYVAVDHILSGKSIEPNISFASGYPALYGKMDIRYSFKDIQGNPRLPFLFSEMLEGSGIRAESVARPSRVAVWIDMWLDDWPGLANMILVDKLKEPISIKNKLYIGQV